MSTYRKKILPTWLWLSKLRDFFPKERILFSGELTQRASIISVKVTHPLWEREWHLLVGMWDVQVLAHCLLISLVHTPEIETTDLLTQTIYCYHTTVLLCSNVTMLDSDPYMKMQIYVTEKWNAEDIWNFNPRTALEGNIWDIPTKILCPR